MQSGAMAILRTNEFSRKMPKETLEAMVKLGYQRVLSRGEFLFLQGDPGECLFLVISGEVRVTAESPEGAEFHLNTFHSGDMLGEIAFLDGGERTVSASATQETVLFCIDRASLLALLTREPGIAAQFIEALCARIRHTTDRLVDHMFLTLDARLCKVLLGVMERSGETDDNGNPVVRMSQQDLARFLNTTRQSINQILQQLQSDGVLSVGRGSVHIHDQAAMKARSSERLVT